MTDVAIIGATGAVGQRFVQLLEHHPWFDVTEVCGNSTVGMRYGDIPWMQDTPIPSNVADMIIKPIDNNIEAGIIFSAIQAGTNLEDELRDHDRWIFSNTRDHRMDEDVPLVIPEVNWRHLVKANFQNPGFIITNPNCSTIGLVLGVYRLHREYGIDEMSVTTLQAISGAGRTGLPAMDIQDNVLPYIGGEEQKLQTEPLKILGEMDGYDVVHAEIDIHASCYRVPVTDGHTLDVRLRLRNQASVPEIKECLRSATSDTNMPSSCDPLIYVFDENDRPQPRRDRNLGNGMATSVGRIREEGDYLRMTILSHNTIRGAAGCSILNAEYCLRENYIL